MLLLQLLFRRFAPLLDRHDSLPSVTPGSSLSGDLKAAPYNPVSDQIAGLLATAVDHLHAVRVSVEDSGGKIMTMALFTLIRSAFESAGTGLWILSPARRDDRVLRSMQLTRDNRRQQRSVRTDLKQPDPGFGRMEAKLKAQLAARAGLFGKGLDDKIPVTSRLEDIAGLFPEMIFPPVTMWRLASGIAHGNSSMMMILLDHEQLDDFTDGAASFKLTSSVAAIAVFYREALVVTEALFDLYDSRNQAP